MTDENKNTSQDDEYQFPQDEYVSSSEAKPEPEVGADNFAEPVEESASRGSKVSQLLRKLPPIKNKRVVVAIAGVLILFIVFHFLNTSKTTPPVQKPVAQTEVATPASAPVQTSDNSDMMGSLNSLRAHSSRTESQIRDLQAQLADMQNNLSQAQATNQALQKSVTELTTRMEGLSAQLEVALSRARPSSGNRIVYHLRAVLPDRAWITSSTGQTVSVTLGDRIKQYGTVQIIDAQRGVITTSSGRKIQYGPNDY